MEDNPIHAFSKSIAKLIAELLAEGSIAALVTIIEGNRGVGSKLLVDETGRAYGSFGDSTFDAGVIKQAATFLASREETGTIRVKAFAPDISSETETLLMFERIRPEPRLVVCGAGHVGASLAKLGSFIGYHVTLIDDRAEFVTREHFPNALIELVTAQSWNKAVQEVVGNGKGVAIAVVTRGHNEDEECMRAIMSRDPDYVGLIGSKRRTNIVIDRLRASGADEDRLRSIRAPIGLDIGAVTPEEVALAILAEMVAERRGGKGGSLSAWRRSDVRES